MAPRSFCGEEIVLSRQPPLRAMLLALFGWGDPGVASGPGHGRRVRLQALGMLLAGAAAGLALPPLGLPPLLWLALVPLWQSSSQGRPLAAAWRGGLWALAAVLVSHRWLLALHPLDWLGVPPLLSLPLCVLLWLAIAAVGALAVGGWSAVVRRLDGRHGWGAIAGAGLWGLSEVLLARGPLFWIGVGSSALPTDPALAGLGALGGSGSVAAVQLLISWGLWRLLRGAWRPALAVTLTLLVLSHGLGAWALALQRPTAKDLAAAADRRSWLVLQPAIPTREKFQAPQQRRLQQLLERALRSAPALGVEGLLLPEGSLALGQRLPMAAGVEVLSGGFRLEESERRSSLLRFPIGAVEPAAWLDKHRVVPLGEWVPFADQLAWAGLSAVGGITPGHPSRLLERPRGAIAVAICYELADGASLAEATRAGATWLVASANLDPYPVMLQQQFRALARQRAIETGRWLLSAANTGPSLVIDPAGEVRQSLQPLQPDLGVMDLLPRRELTPYDRFGELPLLLVTLLAVAIRLRRSGSASMD